MPGLRRLRTVASPIVATAFLLLSADAGAADLQATIDFDVEALPAGTIVSSIQADAGGGVLVGPIAVSGELPSDPYPNSAVIFDSAMRTGGDSDLGTPNEDFGGPGVGNGGEAGAPYENDQAQHNILIVAEDLVDANGDGLVDDPDDGTEYGMVLEFDFRTITAPFAPEQVTVFQITTIDAQGYNPGKVKLYDEDDDLISTTDLIAGGDNGLVTQDIGPPGVGVTGVARMKVQLNGSAAIDDIVFEIEAGDAPTCTIEPMGPFEVEVGHTLTFTVEGETEMPYGTVVLDMVSLPAGATMTPPLPLDSSPGAVATSVFSWTPTSEQEGSHTVVFTVTDPAWQVSTCVAYIEVECDLEIEYHPEDENVCEGDSATFTVVVEATDPVTYQWKRDGMPIPGATSPTLTIDPVTPADEGTYTVVVSNPCDTETSYPAELYVKRAPVIVDQPDDQVACTGDEVTFAVMAIGEYPLYYQWRKEGVEIPGATEPYYTIEFVELADAGTYDVVVTNECGSVTSDPATLMVRTPPVIVDQPDDATACEGDSVSFTVVAEGSMPFYYQWKKDGEPIPGATAPTYTIPSVVLADAGTYTVVVENDCGKVTSDPAVLIVLTAPVITVQPLGQTLCEGEAIVLTVVAIGSEPLSTQWRKDDIPIPGATSPTLVIDPAVAADSGVYTVVVSNFCGSVLSDPAVVLVRVAPVITVQPVGQTLCEGDTLVLTVTATGSPPLLYQWYRDGIPIPGATSPTLTIPAVTIANAGLYTVIVTNDCGSAKSRGALVIVEVEPAILVQPVGGTLCEGDSITLTVVASGTPPLLYQWRKNTVPIPGATASSLVLAPLVRADEALYDVVVTNDCGSATSAPASVVVQNDPTIVTPPVGQTLCVGDTLLLSVVAAGDPPLTYQWRKNTVNIPGATLPTFTIAAVVPGDAGSYDVRVTNPCGTVFSPPAVVVVDLPPTVTLITPGTLTVCAGDPATFQATVGGTPPITLVWRRNGVPIPGANAATYTIPVVSPADAGSYDLVATNECGTDTSDPVTLVVRVAPTVTVPPVGSDTVCPDEGNSFTFTVVAAGSTPLAYQWRKDGVPIPGATASSYTIVEVTTASYGSYTVLITNDCGDALSPPAVLALPAPGVCEVEFSRCDCNADGICDIADGIYIMRFSFQGFFPPPCLEPCDHNDDGVVDIADTIFIMTYIFLGGDPPPPPFPLCGEDPTEDELVCPEFSECPEL